MLINRESLPRNLPWIAVFAAGTVAAIVAYALASAGQSRWPGGGSAVGLTLGVLASLLMLFEFLIWPRKKARAWRLGSAKVWMRAHVWFGFLTVPLVVLHSGFILGGQLSAVLVVLFGVVIASGVFGLVLQQFLPRMMLVRLPAETILPEIDYVAQQSYWDAEDAIETACGEAIGEARSLCPRGQRGGARPVAGGLLVDSFLQIIGPYLLRGSKSESPLRSAPAAADFFRGLRGEQAPEAAGALDALESLCDQRRQFDLQARMHAWLHGWLCVHVPLSVALIGLMFVHIVVALKYW